MHRTGESQPFVEVCEVAQGERVIRPVPSGTSAAGIALGATVESAPFALQLDTSIDDPQLGLFGRSRNLLQSHGMARVRDLFVPGLFYSQRLARIGLAKRQRLAEAFPALVLPADAIPSPGYAALFCEGLHELNPYAVLHTILRQQPSKEPVLFKPPPAASEPEAPRVSWKRLLRDELEPDAVLYGGRPDVARFYGEYSPAFQAFAAQFLDVRTKIETQAQRVGRTS